MFNFELTKFFIFDENCFNNLELMTQNSKLLLGVF